MAGIIIKYNDAWISIDVRGEPISKSDKVIAEVIRDEGRNIKDLTPLVVVLSKFKYLQELSLHGNKISNLPSLESLRQLLSLDISNNPIPVISL